MSSVEDYSDPNKNGLLFRFLLLNVWHYKKAFEETKFRNALDSSDISEIQIYTKRLAEELAIRKLCIIHQAHAALCTKLTHIVDKLSKKLNS